MDDQFQHSNPAILKDVSVSARRFPSRWMTRGSPNQDGMDGFGPGSPSCFESSSPQTLLLKRDPVGPPDEVQLADHKVC